MNKINVARKVKILSSVIMAIIVIIVIVANLFGNIVVVASPTLLSISVDNTTSKLSPEQINAAALDDYVGSDISEKSANQFEISYSGTGSRIEIGSADKTTNFKPDLTISKWNGEASFKLIAPVEVESKSQLSTSLDAAKGSVTATSGEWTFEYKATKPKEGFNEYGGLDMFITAKEKPSSNQIYFTYDSSSVTPYLQPELTEDEIKEGAFRPDHVVNSIAFYADGKANHALGGVNYATGKVGHLYRMQANGQWCNWGIEHEYIVLTIPFEVFDKAEYPLTVVPVGDTFGWTANGASGYNHVPNYAVGGLFTSPADIATATVNSITAWVKEVSSGQVSAFKGLIVLTSTLNIVTNAIGSPCSDYTGTMESYQERTSTFATPPTLANSTSYVLAAVKNDAVGTDNSYVSYDTTGGSRYNDNNNYTTPENFSSPGITTNRRVSIYCTYTPAASFDISNTPSSKAFGIVTSSTTYWAIGHTPDNPIDDAHCTFALTNNAAGACDIDAKMADFTGGVGWNIGAPGENQARITWFKSGDDPAAGIVLTNSDQEVYDNVAGGGHFHWEFKLETPTSVTDGVGKSGVLTLTAVAED